MKNNNFNINDIVRITRGIYKGKLALVIDKLDNIASCRVTVIVNGQNLVYRNNTLVFCYDNTDESVEEWKWLIKHNVEELIKKYNNIKHIKDNFDIDILIGNQIVIGTIFKYGNIKTNDNIFDWYFDNKRALSVIFHYRDTKFVLEYCRLINKTISEEEILRLHKAAWS